MKGAQRMATVDTLMARPPDYDGARPARLAASRWRIVLLGLLLLLAYLPFLLAEGSLLWDQPAHQFFPLVLVGACFLVCLRFRRLDPLSPGAARPATMYLGIAGGL